MKHKIVIYPHPCLLSPAAKVVEFDDALRALVKELYDTMYHNGGIGLAAPQVNISQKILVMDVSEDQSNPKALINPEIIESEGSAVAGEGCLSFPGLYLEIQRATAITIKAQDEYGHWFETTAKDLNARCIQHELDHLNGVVFTDHLSKLKRERALKKFKKYLKQERSS